MNTGASIFLIFLVFAAAFAGVGYMYSEMSHQTDEIAHLKTELENALKAYETERLAHEETKKQLAEAQARNQELQTLTITLQGELETRVDESKSLQPLLHYLPLDLDNRAWFIFPPAVLLFTAVSAYNIRRAKQAKEPRVIGASEHPLNKEIPEAGAVMVCISRNQITDFIRWQKQEK